MYSTFGHALKVADNCTKVAVVPQTHTCHTLVKNRTGAKLSQNKICISSKYELLVELRWLDHVCKNVSGTAYQASKVNFISQSDWKVASWSTTNKVDWLALANSSMARC